MTTALSSADHRPGDALGSVTSELTIGGMHCASCATRSQRSLRGVPAVASASVNLATDRAYVTYDPAELRRRPVRAGQRAGTRPNRYRDGRPTDEPADRDGGRGAPRSWPLALAALVVALGPRDPATGWTVLLLAIAVEVAGGWPFLRKPPACSATGRRAWTRSSPSDAGRPGR